MSSDNTSNNLYESKKDIVINLPITEFQAYVLGWLTSTGFLFYMGYRSMVNDHLFVEWTNFINWWFLCGMLLAITGLMILHENHDFLKFPNCRKLRFIWK